MIRIVPETKPRTRDGTERFCAGVLVLETLDSAEQRGQPPLAEIAGFGASGDAHHVAQPPSDGAGAALAMKRALRDSCLSASHVAYVNAHATSTPLGDSAELQALSTVRWNFKLTLSACCVCVLYKI